MQKLLMVTASPRYSGSHSRALADLFTQLAREVYPDVTLIDRDLVAEPPPHITNEMIHGIFNKPGPDPQRIQHSLKTSNLYTDEVLSADCLAIATPMYNFNVPSTLKAWIDLVVRPGLTFEKVADGNLRGLCQAKRAIVLCSMGGRFANKPNNLLEPYFRLIGDFIGLQQMEFVYLEGTSRDDFDEGSGLVRARNTMTSFLR